MNEMNMALLDPSVHPRTDAAVVLSRGQAVRLCLYAAAAFVFFLWDYVYFFYLLNFAVCLLYFGITLFKFTLVVYSCWRSPAIQVLPGAAKLLPERDLPVYTILVPLYREENVAGSIIRALEALDYPREKLDVKLLLEPDDKETLEAVRSASTTLGLDIVFSPSAGPRTKPKACNEGLGRARGEFAVVYDAEDRPEADQLRKSVLAFRRASPDVVCLQCKLAYYNPHQNWLTRFFAVEYACWFEYFLPGLHGLDMPIPLGGTSNHFRTASLRALGGWRRPSSRPCTGSS